jgi:hypothetical protein
MLVYAPFSLCFVTFRGIFMRFPELTYWWDATVPVPHFLLFLCFRKVTQEIFSELEETKPEPPIFPGRNTKTEGEPEGGQGPTTPGVVPPPSRARGWCGATGRPLTSPLHLFTASVAKTLNQSGFFEKEFCSSAAATYEFQGTKVSIPAPCRDREVPPEPSPLTAPPSPSTMLSPMMRRE